MGKREILLGVDGGNTKTDLFLFDSQAKLLAFKTTSTVSHEAVAGGYAQASALLLTAIQELCQAAGIQIQQIDATALGLAGLDIPPQYEIMNSYLDSYGLRKYVSANDALLGIKAATPSGVGICSINGTGTTTIGIDPQGQVYQVGGIGGVAGDLGGGSYYAEQAVAAVYNEYCRDGRPTSMTGPISRLLSIKGTNDILTRLHYDNLDLKKHEKELNLLIFKSAQEGDLVAREILDQSARYLAAGVAGCYKQLNFYPGQSLQLAAAGSIWAHNEYDNFCKIFQAEIARRIACPLEFTRIKEPPVYGAVLWAYELLRGQPAKGQFRQLIRSQVSKAKSKD